MTTETRPSPGLPTAYDPKQAEAKWYRWWMDRGYFTARIEPGKQPFVIIMPPPNVTGSLHLGHALTATLEDLMVRWHRMKGEPVLWLPGRDHAGIATQVMVERQIAEEGKSRHDLGREQFLERVWEWVARYGNEITEQHMRLGASCDWSRERFTMDPGPSRAVRTTFVRLYEKGLIYRGMRITNWCPRCQTALSDLEVDYEENRGSLWYFRYPLEMLPGESEQRYIQVATTRPETILGDTAVAVNPTDPRYRDLVGRTAILPVIGRPIPIVGDDAVDPSFGTGAVKVTPAHDPVDFEVAQRHHLPSVLVMNLDATMNENAGPYAGQDRYECRRNLVRDLEAQGLLIRVEDYTNNIGHCQRCKTVLEPIISEQWYLHVKPLAERAIKVVQDGQIAIIPERFTKVYFNWMENIRDWCISRQLWWGHRIPVWYCADCGKQTCTLEDPTACAHCNSPRIEQDPDVLDTWFSSALWPHSTLGWPDDTDDLRYFYPTTVMETGYDILFFWVARMIMMGLENTGDIPFRTVYLHGLIRDEKGEKMSKTKGNVVDPLDVIEEFGTDALRFTLSTGSSPGNDMRLTNERLTGSRNFANKLWNAGRFVITNLEGSRKQEAGSSREDGTAASRFPLPTAALPVEDRWILSRLNRTALDVDRLLTEFQFGEANRRLHDFIWSEFCDWYIELAKVRLRATAPAGDGGGQGVVSPLPVLAHVLDQSLRLLHPVMPYVTEEIWQSLRPYLADAPEALMIAPYPQGDERLLDAAAERELELVMEVVRAIRNARTEYNVEAARRIQAMAFGKPEALAALRRHDEGIKLLARTESLELRPDTAPRPEQAVHIVLEQAEVFLPLAGLVDLEAERRRLRRDLEKDEQEVARLEAKLANAEFTAKAPAQVIAKEQARLDDARQRVARMRARLADLRT